MMNMEYLKWVSLIFICLQPGHAQDDIRYNSYHQEKFCFRDENIHIQLTCHNTEFLDVTLVKIGRMVVVSSSVKETCELVWSSNYTELCLLESQHMLHLVRGKCGLPVSSCRLINTDFYGKLQDVQKLIGEPCGQIYGDLVAYIEYGCLTRIDNEFFEIGKDYPGSRSYDGSLFLLSPQYNDYDAATRTYSCDISFKATYATSTVTARQLFSLEVYEFQEDGYSSISFYESNECHMHLIIRKTYLYSDTVDISICPHEHDKFNESELSFSERSGEPTGYNIKYMFNDTLADPKARFVIRINDGEASIVGSTDVDCGTPFVTITPVTLALRSAENFITARDNTMAATENTIAGTENTRNTANVRTTERPTPVKQAQDDLVSDTDPTMLYILTGGCAGLAIAIFTFAVIFAAIAAYTHRTHRRPNQPQFMDKQDSVSLAYSNNKAPTS